MEKLKGKQERLVEIERLLHLAFHHNKNQHRLAKWWRWLSMLRRAVSKLLAELNRSDESFARARLQYLQSIIIPRSYR
jgi:ribonuclease MRP protein subunit RMP1